MNLHIITGLSLGIVPQKNKTYFFQSRSGFLKEIMKGGEII